MIERVAIPHCGGDERWIELSHSIVLGYQMEKKPT